MQQTNLFKVSSVAGNSLLKDVPSGSYHTNPPCEHPKSTTSEMNEQGLEFYSEVSVKSITVSQYHNHNGCNSSCSLISENVNDEVPASAPGTSQHLERLMANAGQTTEVLEVDYLGCEGESLSCISKADGTKFGNGCSGVTDPKNKTVSSVSVSLCQECSDKLVDIQSAKHGSISSDYIAEEGNKLWGSPKYAREALHSSADISDGLNPLKTSSFRDEHAGAVSPKLESFLPARGTDLLSDSQKSFRDPVDVLKTNAEVDGNQTRSGALNNFDQKEHIEMWMTYHPQEPPLEYCAIADNDNSDELVDVRVCDICGVIGREAMLAICSKCSDGAEHIYCMRVKMDKVPEDDWICEECMIMAKAQNQKADEQKNDKALQKLSATMLQSLRKLDGSFDSGRLGVGHTFLPSSRKRPGANLEVSSTKKRMLDSDVKLRSPPDSCAKEALAKHDSMKIMSKSKVASSLARDSLGNVLQKARQPLAGKSSNIVSQFHKGSLFNQNCSNGTYFKTQQKGEDVYRDHKTSKGSPTSRPGLHHGLTKMRKSKSFIASNIESLDTSGLKKIMHNDFKISKVGSKCSLTQRSYFFNSKIPQLVSPLGGSSILRIKPAKAALAQAEVKQQAPQSYMGRKTAEVHKDVEKDSIQHIAKRQFNKRGYGFDKTKSCSIAGNGRRSQNCVRASSGLGQKAYRKIANMEPQPISKDSELQLNDTNKAQLNSSPSRAAVHLAEIVHPNVDCLWRGIFNVSGCNKLPVSCTQLQAHMSSCASPKAHQVVSMFPCEIIVEEVLQRDIWPAQFLKNFATEDNIALYFFAEGLQSYQSYKKFLNCMVLNELALKSDLDDLELLIFPSQILPARSQRWNNLFFLWGVFRAKKSGFDDDTCLPSSHEATPICNEDIVTSPQRPPLPIPAGNLCISTQVGSGPSDALSGSVQGPGSGNQRLQSFDLTKSTCLQGSSWSEVDVKMMASTLMLKEQHSGELQTKNKAKEENRSQNQDPEVRTVVTSCPSVSGAEIPVQLTIGVECGNDASFMTHGKHRANIDFNHPHDKLSSAIYPPTPVNEVPVYDAIDGGLFSLNSGPSDSGEAETSKKAMGHHHALNLELSLWSEREPATYEGDVVSFPVLPNRDAGHANTEASVSISLDLSLALPSTDNDPALVMALLPEKDNVDTSLFLFSGLRKA